MQKNLALLVIALIFVLAFVPAYYQPADDALGGNSSPDAYSQLFTAVHAVFDFDQCHVWTGLTLTPEIAYRLPPVIPAATETRAPPA